MNALDGPSDTRRRFEMALLQMLHDRAIRKPNAPGVREMADRLAAISREPLTLERVYEMTLGAARISSPRAWNGAEDACFRRGRDEAIEAIRDQLESVRKQQDGADDVA